MPFKGTGLAALEQAHVKASNFESTDNTLCGVMVGSDASMDLMSGRVANNVIGANVQAAGYPVARLTSEVTYESNQTNLDSTTIAVPMPTAPMSLLSP